MKIVFFVVMVGLTLSSLLMIFKDGALSGRSGYDAIDRAALRIMIENVSPHVGKYGVSWGSYTERDIKANQESLDKFKTWVASVSDGAQRKALERWVVVEQRSIDESRSELITGAIRKEDEARHKRYSGEDSEVVAAMKLFEQPPKSKP